MSDPKALLSYVLQLGDSSLILAQRISEWTGHGPVLEQDIALSNIALDLLGQAQNFLEYAGTLCTPIQTADQLAFLRVEGAYHNHLMVERPNGDWGKTILRQFFFDAYNYHNLQALTSSQDAQLKAIADKAFKEATYHLRYSSEWVIRLGDGTEESHNRMLTALDDLWAYTGELTAPNAVDKAMATAKVAPDLTDIRVLWKNKVTEVLNAATLPLPNFDAWMQSGGKVGTHTEHLGFLLAEMQHMQRAYPGAEW